MKSMPSCSTLQHCCNSTLWRTSQRIFLIWTPMLTLSSLFPVYSIYDYRDIMRVPLEILRQILGAAVEVLPFSELFRARLVDTFFADEIWLLVLESDRLEEDGLGYRNKSQEFHYWGTFPEHLKRQYLYRKIKRYPQDQSMFSYFMHEVLALEADSIRDKEEEGALISKMIDAVYWERPRCGEIFSSKLASFWLYRSSIQNGVPALESLHPPEADLKIALVCSAIKDNNCDELQKLLRHGVALMTVSYRFGVAPLTFAAQNGNRETMTTLLKYGRPGPWGYWDRKDFQRAMIAAAGCGNKDAYTELLAHKPIPGGFLGWKPKKNPAAAFMKAVRDGNVEMVGFILEEYIYNDVATLRCKGLIHAVSFGQLDVMKLLLDREDLISTNYLYLIPVDTGMLRSSNATQVLGSRSSNCSWKTELTQTEPAIGRCAVCLYSEQSRMVT